MDHLIRSIDVFVGSNDIGNDREKSELACKMKMIVYLLCQLVELIEADVLQKVSCFHIIALLWRIVCQILKIIKVEKILKVSLDLIKSPSPSVKIQIMDGKVCLRCEGKTLLGIVNQQCFAFLPQVNFPQQ